MLLLVLWMRVDGVELGALLGHAATCGRVTIEAHA